MMLHNKAFIKKLLTLTVLVCVFSSTLFAQTESYIQTLTGVIKPRAVCTVVDEKFSDAGLWATVKKNVMVQNLVTFEVRFDTSVNFFIKPFNCELLVDIVYKDSANREKKLSDIKLTLQYDTAKGKPYKGVAYYKFSGGHEATVTVKSITSKEIDVAKASFLRVKNQIMIDRVYKIRQGNKEGRIISKYITPLVKTTSGPLPSSAGTFENGGRQFEITWNAIDFEYDTYDLEYTFYDAKSYLAIQNFSVPTGINETMLAAAFKNNATRITLNNNNYTLNLVYPKGFLLVRIRAYTYNEVDGEMDREEYPWHYDDVDGISDYAVYEITDVYEHHFKLTWQYSASFAEEGKRKEVVSYFDGGLKSRQSVTLSNSDDVTIVAESILDKLNRPAVNVLPVPTTDNTLHYFYSFNRNSSGNVYSYADFNNDAGCASNAAVMNTSYGASLYYSPNNAFVNNSSYPNAMDISKNVPDAFGFPFAVTEFTRDQTGRIRRQGGVGPKFQVGEGHETSYYYGKPAQEELDRLFGSEAGAASHYSKNMVVDANGQVSISYVDIAGKTVATALAGNSPSNVKALNTQAGAVKTIVDELVRPQAIVRDADNMKLSFNTTVMVPAASDYNFKYEFTGRSLELIFGFDPEKKVCADCYYDVKFSITDECGELVNLTYDNASHTSLLIPAIFSYGNNGGTLEPNTECGEPIPPVEGDIVAHFPKTGEYRVSYELIMSRKALDYYMEYLKQLNVMKTEEEFKKDYLKKIDLTGCFNDCRDCRTKLGTQAEFIERMKKILEQVDNITITTDDIEWIKLLYNEALAKCGQAETVGKNCTITDACADQRKLMLKDLTPGGQYMLYDGRTLLFKEREINVFVKKIQGNSLVTDDVLINRNGVEKLVKLNSLHESEVISNWKPEWAYLMLKMHPEYCLLQECESQSASKNRDKAMLQTDDAGDALSDFSWIRTEANYQTFVAAEMALVTSPFITSCIQDAIEEKIEKYLENVRVMPAGGGPETNADVSLREFIRFLVYCDNKPPVDPVTNRLPYIDLNFPTPPDCDRPLDEWRIFRNLYIAIKQNAYRNPDCKSGGGDCKNCYIGVNLFSSLYNEKAEPNYYPQMKDFIIEETGSGTGLQVTYTQGALNNRCDVYVYKANVTGSGDAATFVEKLEFPEGETVLVLAGVNMNQKELYFVERVINNYNHNIDGTSTPSNCPNAGDFEIFEGENGNPYVRFIGKYPLLNKVHLHIILQFTGGWGSGCNFSAPYDIYFDPLETVAKKIRDKNCDIEYHNSYIEWADFCISTQASCISDSRWPDYFHKQRRFYESNSVDDILTVLGGTNDGSGTSPMGDGDYQQNAIDQLEGWLEKLKGCGSNPAKIAEFRDRLILICVKGSDQLHPFGSSSTKDDIPTVPYGDRSFKDAIEWYLSGPETPICNELLIDFPLPYTDGTLLNDVGGSKLEDCGCDLLTRFRTEWNTAGGASNPQYPTLNVYIRTNYDPNFYLTDKQIEELEISCSTGCPTERPMRIPGILTRCDDPETPTCLKCTQLYNVEQQFQETYPQYPPTLANYYELLAGYINRVYQMNVAPSAVYAAIQKCKDGEEWEDGCGDKCELVIGSLQKFYTIMPLSEYYTKLSCEEISCQQVQAKFREHITIWLNLTLGWNHTYNWYYDNYFDSCAVEYYFEPSCEETKRKGLNPQGIGPGICSCTEVTLRCCDYYSPFIMFRSMYPNPVDPRLLAFFFELRRYTYCAPINLPNISYLSPYSTLVSYFSTVVPTVIPNCEKDDEEGGHDKKAKAVKDIKAVASILPKGIVPDAMSMCDYWTFTFKPIYACNSIFDPTFNAGDFVLCSQPLTPVYQSDPDACVKSVVHASLSNAEYAYEQYVKDFMRDYREAYFAKCLSITPSLVMDGEQREYHYTLYYYDQAGNLVKTIPPKGVVYLDNEQIEETGRLRDEDNGECYKNSTAPEFTNNSTHLVTVPNNFFPLHNDGPLTIESWVDFTNVNNKQVIVNQFDENSFGKAGYYAYIENGKLYFNMFGRAREKWRKFNVQWLYPTLLPNVQAKYYLPDVLVDRERIFKASCHTENLITSSASSSPFYHIVFQYSGDPNDKRPVKIYVNGILQTLNWGTGGSGYEFRYDDSYVNVPHTLVPTVDAIKYELESVQNAFTTASTADLVAGTLTRTVDGTSMNGITGKMKHLRIYNSAPDATDLRRNSYEDCYMPAIKEGLVLWLPMNKAIANRTEDIQSGNDVSIVATWATPALPQYPEHNMPTYYAYNSLNQVISQETPDAGESNFWYDRLGRLTASQNSEQLAPLNGGGSRRYSYTLYDEQGRINEVGEKIDGDDITLIDTQNDPLLQEWLLTGTDKQVTKTIYDDPNPLITTDGNIILAQLRNYNSRKRVATSVYMEDKVDISDYNYATHYVYDISGNVKRIYQENRKLPNNQVVGLMRTLDYEFDLISGKVNQLWYQKDQPDQYLYRYYYNADNKLVDAQSGRDEPTLRHDARYNYYLHGSLARIEFGHDIVQGVDYANTLQGWIKGINGLFLNNHGQLPNYDMGNDGVAGTSHAEIPADVYNYTVGYFDGDYAAVNDYGSQHPLSVRQFGYNTATDPTGYELFNGNIAYTSYANRFLANGQAASYSYLYDQLNRIAEMRNHESFDASSGGWNSASIIPDYAESISYDANGNILTYNRNGFTAQSTDMDQLTYYYKDEVNNNKLDYVDDMVDDWVYSGEDIDAQVADNYRYDNIGNLVKDIKEDIDNIQWTVYGKIRSITKVNGTFIEYGYDASGNRVSKTVTNDQNGADGTTYYFRDGQGTVLGLYKDEGVGSSVLYWKEQHLYGVSRLGMWRPEIDLSLPSEPGYEETIIGTRNYELTNHLGNVLSVITDKKTEIFGGGGSYWEAEVLSANDYYPFGMGMPGRKYQAGDGYRYGFNGKENDNEAKGEGNQQDYGMRIYDPRLGRFLSEDPLTKEYPGWSPYPFAMNDVIRFIDLDGAEKGDPPYKKDNVNFVQLFSPIVSGIKRSDGKTFTQTAINFDRADKIDYIINAQQYEMNGLSNPYSAGDNSDWEAQGRTTAHGKIFVGRSSPQTFYFAISGSNVTFGKGDPPLNVNIAVGGAIPVIVNGLKYGEHNIYSPGAPANLPKVGDPGAENQKYLIQRSNAGYPKQDYASLGKSIVGYNSKTGAFMLAVQEDGTSGMSLTQIRDYLGGLGYDNVLSFDGSDSATMVRDSSVVSKPGSKKNNTIPSGIRFQVLTEEKK